MQQGADTLLAEVLLKVGCMHESHFTAASLNHSCWLHLAALIIPGSQADPWCGASKVCNSHWLASTFQIPSNNPVGVQEMAGVLRCCHASTSLPPSCAEHLQDAILHLCGTAACNTAACSMPSQLHAEGELLCLSVSMRCACYCLQGIGVWPTDAVILLNNLFKVVESLLGEGSQSCHDSSPYTCWVCSSVLEFCP